MSGTSGARSTAPDADVRARVVGRTDQSFLVQAPAGSGKTELLIQRFLALLGQVEEPERVLAITFTRKAAAERREGVWRALPAAKGADVAAGHERTTRELAQSV